METREDRYTAVDCRRTAEFDGGREAPDIVQDPGRACLGGGEVEMEGGGFLRSSTTGFAGPFSFFSSSLRTLVYFLSFLSCEERVMECVCRGGEGLLVGEVLVFG